MAQKQSFQMIANQDAKRWLRHFALRNRQSLSASQRSRWSDRIISKLLSSAVYKQAKTVAVYLSFGNEVDTCPLVERAWKDKKKVLIPITSRGLRNPFFSEYKKGDGLKKTKFGPKELSRPTTDFPWKKIDLVVVPGLAFDPHGHRLGYGGGTYDRILSKTPHAKHVGLFFLTQKIDRLPSEKHDYKLSKVITD